MVRSRFLTHAAIIASVALVCDGFMMSPLLAGLPRRGASRVGVKHQCSGILTAHGSTVMERPSATRSIRDLFEQTPGRRPRGYWKVFDNVEAEVMSLVDKLNLDGVMPTEAQLRKHSLSSLSDAMHEMGGFAEVAKKLGLKTSKPRGFWNDFDNVVSELEAWMEGRGNSLPTQAELRKAGRTDLISAMQKHGGMVKFADHLKLAMSSPTCKRQTGYSVRTQLEDHISDFVRDHGINGVMPSAQLLMAWGRHDLLRGIERHGGMEHMSRKTNLEIRRPDSELVEVGRELLDIAKQLGDENVMPSIDDLTKNGRSDLASILQKRGIEESACLIGMCIATKTPPTSSVTGPTDARMPVALMTSLAAPAGGRLAEAQASAARRVAAQGKARAALAATSAMSAYSTKSQNPASLVGAPAASPKAISDMREALKAKLSERAGDALHGVSSSLSALF